MAVELLSVSDTRSRLLKLVNSLGRVPDRFVITTDGKPRAVLMSFDEYQSMQATVETMLDPEMVKGIKQGLVDKKARRIKSFEEVFGEPL
jgi:prevent-host-death family protein